MAFKTSQTTGGAYLSDDLMLINADNSNPNVYDNTTIPSGQYKIPNTSAAPLFGQSVDIGNNKIVVGSGNYNAAISVYDLNYNLLWYKNVWQYEGFAHSVGIGNDRIVVGAPYGSRGAFYIYTSQGDLVSKITATDNSTFFGNSVAIGNGRIVVGAPLENNTGAVHIYNLNGNFISKIVANDGSSNDSFGDSVAIGNGRIVVGATTDDNKGSIYIYDLNGNFINKLQPNDLTGNSRFGHSVAVRSGRIVVGSPQWSDVANPSTFFIGAVYIYDLNGNFINKLVASDLTSQSYFGYSVDVGNGRIVVGSPNNPYDTSLSGSCYIFDLNGNQIHKITSVNTGSVNEFGCSVAVGNNKIIVGDRFDNAYEGSAYIYNTPPIKHTLDILD